jgi:CubicO group peptidase (beta-lactamase class C family)
MHRFFPPSLRSVVGLSLVSWLVLPACPGEPLEAGRPTRFSRAVHEFEQVIQAELNRGIISGVSVALVDDQEMIYCNGFGFADKARRRPADRNTVYRAGSISKLFTALATMQLVEQGKIDLDQPVTRYVSDFQVINPFAERGRVTLRQLMCHRSGMVRESPVGSYFDDSEPTLAETVASLASCVLVYPPNTKTKYSNSGVTIVGSAVERVSGERFVAYQEKHLLTPMGMKSSSFLLNRTLKPRLAKGYLPVADGRGGFREIETPHFELGTIPAGNLYTTAEDLARFLSFLFAPGRNAKPILKAETLAQMFTPQLSQETNGFGLGFNVGHFRGHKTINHSGAVYGFSSLISGMPEEKIGVVILCNDDIAVGPVRKLGAVALSLMLEAKLGEKPPPLPATQKVGNAELERFAGEFESESFWAEIKASAGDLQANISGQRMTLVPLEELKFEGNGRLAYEAPFVFDRDDQGRVTGFAALNQKFRRVSPGNPPEIPAQWRKFLGQYGPRFIPLIVSVKHGHLYAMTENEFDNRLWPLNQTVFKMPPGLYTDEQLVFQLGANGEVHSAVLANMTLKRGRSVR